MTLFLSNGSQKDTSDSHSIVSELIEVKGIGGPIYLLVVIDDNKEMTIIYFLRARSEVFMYFKQFISVVEHHKKKKTKNLRTYDVCEICRIDLLNYLISEDIV